ncbi:mercuric transport protein MerTP [Runella slithyformis]|uniref:Mercuric transport protein MerT n=1 Tax=Runella slithyformis (strain ATCC 29530 / DSM 19594 / LMG 11500 / NCIMB 11436 / LSU 4) TaxID=761193 RepID=A0A7U3ZRN4_RUNSL|nr:mercuric transport protein MerTP [Runella slithyformis]AEI52072.1 Heavy metal transport/detoxification protein [Runella slithyformis DSM 19594]
MKTLLSLSNLSLLTALSSSLCCIMPILAIFAGTSGIVSTFSWVEPARPFFIGATLLILGFAWYQKLTPKKRASCDCEHDRKKPFWDSKSFLGIITVLSFLLLAFPSYSHLLFQSNKNQAFVSEKNKLKKVEFTISGMTCAGCEQHIKAELQKLKGVVVSEVSYINGSAKIQFDAKQVTVSQITQNIQATGYKVVKHKIIIK